MDIALILASGIAWTIVYIEAIRVGFRERTYAMPAVALGLNFAWEWTYAVHNLAFDPSVQGGINLVWGIADAVIVYTFFRYGRAEFPSFVTPRMFAGLSVLLFGTSFAVQWLFLAKFGAEDGAGYSAFLQNLLMSALFVAMFVARRGLRGQSVTIAVAKWLGTLAPTILFGALQHDGFLLGLGIMCSVLDLVYVWLCVGAKRDGAVFGSADSADSANSADSTLERRTGVDVGTAGAQGDADADVAL
ncbi:hypothetical protein [Streptomyces sp. NPDC051572]|uniref:transmembrane-type terpene cyclase n=1 Tax=unclassified Streptomyces TaxID=2593676 RepID=UPI00344BD315